jgi:eukaryotic-like serine/threonine-protein kinase
MADRPDRPAGNAEPATAAPSLVGRSVGGYEIIAEIGRGGMAAVYRADDAKHRRPVALKVLQASSPTPLGDRRFRREIELVAGLQHPHILPLFDSGEVDGRPYFVMPLVRGGTLRDRLASGPPLGATEACRIVAQIAEGLEYAHRRGVVHRDVKPANVLLDDDGHALISDFGIARLNDRAADTLTADGEVVGTFAYMSPEQLYGGGEVDHRADIFALAAVAFEMLSGAPPPPVWSMRLGASGRRTAPAPSVSATRPDLSPAVDEVLRRALDPDPSARHSSTRDFAQDLEAATLGRHLTIEWGSPRRSRRRLFWLSAAGMGLAVAVGAFAVRRVRADETPSIAVLPFVNMSGDPSNDYFSDGVTEELTGALAQLGRIRVTPRTTAFAYKGRTGDIRRIGRELDVARILEGSVRRDGQRVRVVATLYDAGSGDRLWTNRYERSWGGVIALQSEIAGTIAGHLRRSLLPADRQRLAARHPANAEAYDAYLKGRYFFDRRTLPNLVRAREYFGRALAIDSNYARAWAGLADTYSVMAFQGGGAPRALFPDAEHAARRALALDSLLPEAHVSESIIRAFYVWDFPAAVRSADRAIALDSTLASAWFFRTWALAAEGRLEEAEASILRAAALDPLTVTTVARVASVYRWRAKYAQAESASRAALALDPSHPIARIGLARGLSRAGRHAEAIAALPPDSIHLGNNEAGFAGVVYARAGMRERALAQLRALQQRPYVPAEGVAAIYTALGDTAAALDWLERAVEARATGLFTLSREEMFDGLRPLPRFKRIAARVAPLDAAAGPAALAPVPRGRPIP